ncbi:hypothetical protein FRUB_06404 [Fimbriiglobus ruber]|uniref:Alpha-2-macroglobulin domain-containing protein n=1 Tax=Fimbriiglobus ruber TaxID=1908690 RepID=A0A225DNX6_9BACT|nr:hypothetical protein FRUB_06404 [Fimbriiglobus ruber]
MKDARANVVANVDGRQFYAQTGARFTIASDATGTKAVLNLRFKLPADLFDAAPHGTVPTATFSVNIQDGSDAEAIVRPIPLVTKTLSVAFFPEGGEMIAGVPGRVYFQVRTPLGKPADLRGTITDGTNTVAEVATLTDAEQAGVNRGQGVFTLTPRAGTTYFLKLTSPAGISPPTKDGYALPAVKADGIALTALDAVTGRGDPIRVRLQTARGPKTLHVGAYARGRLIAQRKLKVEGSKPVDVALQGDDTAGGVTRVTVFEEIPGEDATRPILAPRAERLVYRVPGEQLTLGVTPDKMRYLPGGKVRLELSATNERQAPTPAVLLVGVVNRSVVAMADNKTDRLMPTHFLLAGDVAKPADLEHADFLLTDHPKAGVALDLLLGTQGWRRFAEQTGTSTDPADRTEVVQMLTAHGQQTSAPVELAKLEEQRLSSEFRPKMETAALQADDADRRLSASKETSNAAVAAAQVAIDVAERAQTAVATELRGYKSWFEKMPFVLTFVGLAMVFVSWLFFSAKDYLTATDSEDKARHAANLKTGCTWAGLGVLALLVVLTAMSTVFFASHEAPSMAFEAVGSAIRPGAAMDPAAPPTRDEAAAHLPAPRPGVLNPTQVLQGPRVLAGQQGDPQVQGGQQPQALAGQQPSPVENAQAPRKPAAASPLPDRSREQSQIAAALRKHQPAGVGTLVPPSVLREYAHQRDPALGSVRSDFTETVYWHPVLVLPASGKAAVEFQLSDDIARYQVLVAGHTTDGRIGATTAVIEARKPFSVDPKLPLEMSHTDIVEMPVRITNDSDDPQALTIALTPTGLRSEGSLTASTTLAANGKTRQTFSLKANKLQGDASVLVRATNASGDTDAILRTTRIVPDGFPGVGSISDTIESRARGTITLPKDVVPGSLAVKLEVYTSTMSDLLNGLEGMLREPHGCFEQTSTANYPNTMILDYLNQTNQSNPQVARRAKQLLDQGYARLTNYECPDTPLRRKQGFEWFGSADMAHEALTAYGLLQFKDMARVHPVDPELIRRTQAFLLSRRDGAGGFRRNARALDGFGGAPKHTTDAYIVWALVESDPEDAERLDLKTEIAALKTAALDENSVAGKDAYFVALTANVLLLRGDRETAHRLLDRLRTKHFKDGEVTGAVTSITRSGGRALAIETTALALLGWLRANDPTYAPTIKSATKWLSQQRGGYGGYGSTQSTILALKALSLHAKKSAHPAESGVFVVLVGGRSVGVKKFDEKDGETITLDIPNPEAAFQPGERTEVEITTDARQPYPFALSYSYTTLTPLSAEQCAVRIGTKLARADAREGDTVPLSVTLENSQRQGQGMAVAVVGLPAGLKVPTDMKQLTDLREKQQISYFEIRGRELILYWRELAPEQKIALTVDLVCDVPGRFRGPASRAYLYYNADHKHWVEPLSIKIEPMAGREGRS